MYLKLIVTTHQMNSQPTPLLIFQIYRYFISIRSSLISSVNSTRGNILQATAIALQTEMPLCAAWSHCRIMQCIARTVNARYIVSDRTRTTAPDWQKYVDIYRCFRLQENENPRRQLWSRKKIDKISGYLPAPA